MTAVVDDTRATGAPLVNDQLRDLQRSSVTGQAQFWWWLHVLSEPEQTGMFAQGSIGALYVGSVSARLRVAWCQPLGIRFLSVMGTGQLTVKHEGANVVCALPNL